MGCLFNHLNFIILIFSSIVPLSAFLLNMQDARKIVITSIGKKKIRVLLGVYKTTQM